MLIIKPKEKTIGGKRVDREEEIEDSHSTPYITNSLWLSVPFIINNDMLNFSKSIEYQK